MGKRDHKQGWEAGILRMSEARGARHLKKKGKSFERCRKTRSGKVPRRAPDPARYRESLNWATESGDSQGRRPRLSFISVNPRNRKGFSSPKSLSPPRRGPLQRRSVGGGNM